MKSLFAIGLIMLLGGCSTLQSHTNGSQAKPYLGTSKAISKAKQVWHDYDYFGQFSLYAMDVPACMVADTILLPYDLAAVRASEVHQK